jgi:dihydroflavonol-4-reductase
VMDGIQLEVVGVDDAARAMILAAERGRNGERYIISEKMMTNREIVRIAAQEAGAPMPQRSVPVPALYAMAAIGSLKARLEGTDEHLNLPSVRLMRAESELDHTKATRQLGWEPQPVEESIRAAARFWVQLRAAMRKAKAPQAE